MLTKYLETEDERTTGWVNHKRNPIIAAGLNPSCSLIPLEIWTNLRKHTNAVEQSHWKSYALGKQATLMPAIME
jgi:hypothetical protein